MAGVTKGMVVGVTTEAIAGEGMILTAGGVDTHIHFISPQQIFTALASGVTTFIGGGTGPATGTDATVSADNTSTTIIRRLRSVRSVHAPIARPKSRCGTVNVAAAAPSATAEPESLNTTSGSAKKVIEFPKFEIVSPTKNFQKSDLSRSPHPSRMSSCGRDHLGGFVRRVTRVAFVCAV